MGRRKRISDLTFEQLKGLPWGRNRPEFADEPLMTLRENLELYASRTRLMVEIKSRKHDRESGRSFETTLNVLKELERPEIQKHAEKIFILSFDPDALKLWFEHAPQYKYVLNVSDEPGGPTGYQSIVERPYSETGHLFAHIQHPKIQFLNELTEKIFKRIYYYYSLFGFVNTSLLMPSESKYSFCCAVSGLLRRLCPAILSTITPANLVVSIKEVGLVVRRFFHPGRSSPVFFA